MDADDDIEDSSMSLDGKTKKKRKSKFARALERRKPVFDPGMNIVFIFLKMSYNGSEILDLFSHICICSKTCDWKNPSLTGVL